MFVPVGPLVAAIMKDFALFSKSHEDRILKISPDFSNLEVLEKEFKFDPENKFYPDKKDKKMDSSSAKSQLAAIKNGDAVFMDAAKATSWGPWSAFSLFVLPFWFHEVVFALGISHVAPYGDDAAVTVRQSWK